MSMLHEISEVFISGKAEAGGRAVDHGIHGSETCGGAPTQQRSQDLDDLFRRGDPKTERGLRHPGVSRHREDRGKRGARNSQQEMLAAPRRKASHTRVGGPGRSSAAMTSQSTSSAGQRRRRRSRWGGPEATTCGKHYLASENGRKFSRLQEKSDALLSPSGF